MGADGPTPPAEDSILSFHPDRNYEALLFILYIVFLYPPLIFFLYWKFPILRRWFFHPSSLAKQAFFVVTIPLPYAALRAAVALVQIVFR